MAKINTEWAVEEIDRFLYATDMVPHPDSTNKNRLPRVMRAPSTEVSERAHVVELILDRALPGWSPDRTKRTTTDSLREKASRARAALHRQEELAANLGDDAPEMDVGALHPWAWENGRSFWLTGHHHQAVMQAAMRVNAETQAKLGRKDISETDLFNQAFSLDPPKAEVRRLRLMADDGSKTYTNVHRGARAFAEGLYAAIRNPGAHDLPELGNEQLAMEQLAAFSLLARWVDAASVEAA